MNMKANAVKSNRSISKGVQIWVGPDAPIEERIEEIMNGLDTTVNWWKEKLKSIANMDSPAQINNAFGDIMRSMESDMNSVYWELSTINARDVNPEPALTPGSWSSRKSVRKSAIRKDHVIDSWLSPDQIGFESRGSDGEWSYSAAIPTGDGEGISIYFMINEYSDSVSIAYAVSAGSTFGYADDPTFRTPIYIDNLRIKFESDSYHSWDTDDGRILVDSIDEAKEWIADFINKLRANIASSTSGAWSSRKSIIKSRRL